MVRRGIAPSALILLAACAPSNRLQGNWIIDIETTTRSAAAATGIPDIILGRQISRTFEGGFMRIDEDRMTLGIEGIDEVVAHNYTVVAEEGKCTRLRIAPKNLEHRYCVDGDRLTTYDPERQIPVIFKRG